MNLDFVADLFNLITVKASIVVMFVSWLISKQRFIHRDAQGRLPEWFPGVPMLIGFLGAIPSYILGNVEAIMTQPVWITALLALQQGVVWGAVAIGLWSCRSLIPYFAQTMKDKDS